MKPLQDETDSAAREILETVPLVMRSLRQWMRSHREAGLSVPQFRALTYISRHAGASLTEIAEHLGLALPSVSKLIGILSAKGLVSRAESTKDRRCLLLNLTAAGQALIASAKAATLSSLALSLKDLTGGELQTVSVAMRILRQAVDAAGKPLE